MKRRKNNHLGSSFDEILEEDLRDDSLALWWLHATIEDFLAEDTGKMELILAFNSFNKSRGLPCIRNMENK